MAGVHQSYGRGPKKTTGPAEMRLLPHLDSFGLSSDDKQKRHYSQGFSCIPNPTFSQSPPFSITFSVQGSVRSSMWSGSGLKTG
jgi:hypothetical protein